ncbi:MAG: hypothetical protein WKF37_09700 [Bryobacteraceae bacterium]
MSANSMFGAAYTFSKAISYADNSDSGLVWNWEPMWERNRAPASFDRTHNLQLFGSYDLPFGRGKQWAQTGIAGLLAGGWQVNAIMSRLSGTPFTVATAGTSLNAPGNTQTADQVVAEVRIPGGHGRGESYFDPNAFAPVAEVRFGNTGRNILRGPGLFNLDASVFRNFRVSEQVTLQFRTEVFGATNTPQFSGLTATNATVSSATRNADGSIRR